MKLLDTLSGNRHEIPPVWLMRQAGRHLPEYHDLRAKADDFLSFCRTPSLAVEASLQPHRRYGLDAVIVFSDILLLLDALGRPLQFVDNTGPLLDPMKALADLAIVPLDAALEYLSPVHETLAGVRAKLDSDTALIGFAGAPWTLSVYAIQGKVGGDCSGARLAYLADPEGYCDMLALLAEAVAGHLARQIAAGADVVMLFDSWATGLDARSFNDLVIAPNAAIVRRLREMGVDAPVIGFARGAGANIEAYAEKTHVNCIGLDSSFPPQWINAHLAENLPIQGNLDPLLLKVGGDRMDSAIDHILHSFYDRPLVFNLGHGVRPDTPIAHVERLVARVRCAHSDNLRG